MPNTSHTSALPQPAADPQQGEWKARPVLAWFIRAGLIVFPLIVSWLSVRVAMRFVTRPSGFGPTVVWFGGAVVLSSIVFQIVRRVIGRFSSLGVLFSLSLTFPDAAPSRMRAFLGAGVDENAGQLEIMVDSEFDAAMKSKRLAGLVATVSRREARSGRHGDRVRGYAELIAGELGLSEEEIERLRWATLLHDVGLLDVPQRILDSRNGLTPEERELVEQHPVHAIGYLAAFADWLGPWAGAATDHHERWDGTGYPAGLTGEEISLAGRIVAVADAYDAMTALRSYQKPITPAAARHELVDKSGTQFDPAVVRAFLNVGIHTNRAGLGTFGALVELPGQLLTAVSTAGAGAGAGVAVASALVVATTAVAVPSISTEVEEPAVQVDRVVDESVETTTTTTETTTTTAPTTTRRRPTTTSTTTTTEPPTTSFAPTTTSALPPPTTSAAPPPPTTATAPPLPTTTTLPPYPTLPATTLTLPPTTITLPLYPAV